MRTTIAVFLLYVATAQQARASGHGPVFGLATPTNPKGGWSFDANLMGRAGRGSGIMFRPALGYGLTENLKISVSAPVIFKADPFAASRMSAFTSMMGDFEATAIWRFHRQDTGIGSRFESALIGGLIQPGPQDSLTVAGKPVGGGTGALAGGVTGFASRSHYAWAGATYQRYRTRDGDQRPGLLFYTLSYAYRPPSWRTDTGWDWRVFGEMTGERSGIVRSGGNLLARTASHVIFAGPTTLGVYKNYAVSAGVQFPVSRPTTSGFPRERFRFALNVAYFF